MHSPSAELPADQLTFVPLRDCGRWLSGGTPSTEEPSFWDGDIPWITASSLTTFHLEDSERKLTELGLQNGSRLVPRGTILFVVRGMSLKSEFRMGITMRPCAFGQDCKAILPSSGFDPLFLAYAIKAKTGDILELVDEAGHGTGRLQTDLLSQLPIPAPPLAEQQRIAEILGSLDDKIELNRRMNRTLEELARAVFKAWFVDFLPVKAKQDGARSFPGTDADTFALFPDSFEDSPLGPIPKGWRVSTVGEESDVTMGQSPPGSTYNEIGEGMPFFQGRADFGVRFPSNRVYCTAPTRFANPGDTLVSVRAPVGDTNMAIERSCIGRGVAAIRHKGGSRSLTYYTMIALRSALDQFEGAGTVFGSINGGEMRALKVAAAPIPIHFTFDRMVAPLDDLIESNTVEARTLAATRDLLLPRLLSGYA